MRRGNCYVASEALYHLLGGKAAGWTPMQMQVPADPPQEGIYDSHWFLRHSSGQIVDPTASQFLNTTLDYSAARGRGFLTLLPSKKAALLMQVILWRDQL